LKCFEGDVELGLTEISRTLDLHKSTAAGIVGTLKAGGFLCQNERNGKYRLGLDLFSLAVQARRGLSDICDPHLSNLLEVTGETVNLAVLDDTEVVCVAKKDCLHSIRISPSVGARNPIYSSASGKAILAAMERDKAIALLDRVVFQKFTANTITDRADLISQLDAVAQNGVAYDFEENERGVVSIAAALYHKSREPIGAASVSLPSVRVNAETRARITESVSAAAMKICGELSRLA
jgi:DNA-binding IclR family transcriptional regulator